MACADAGHRVEPPGIVYVQQVAEAAAEVVLLWPRFSGDEAGIALERRPTAAALTCASPVHVLQFQRLIVKEIGQANRCATLQSRVALKLDPHPTPVLRR